MFTIEQPSCSPSLIARANTWLDSTVPSRLRRTTRSKASSGRSKKGLPSLTIASERLPPAALTSTSTTPELEHRLARALQLWTVGHIDFDPDRLAAAALYLLDDGIDLVLPQSEHDHPRSGLCQPARNRASQHAASARDHGHPPAQA